MTGFGEGVARSERLSVTVEVKSVNNRYLKLSVKLPESHASLENLVERTVRERLSRGTVSIFVRLTYPAGQQPFRLNEAVVEGYLKQLEALGGRRETVLAAVVALPGAIEERVGAGEAQKDWDAISAAIQQALTSLEAMRVAEGRAMQVELHSQCRAIAQKVDQIAERGPASVESYRERFAERVRELLSTRGISVGESDMIREVAIFAERTDVVEELARLRSHLVQFEQWMEGPEPCGRKLDFLGQEMFRESNTIGAKSGDIEIAGWVVELKSAVERIREVIANVE